MYSPNYNHSSSFFFNIKKKLFLDLALTLLKYLHIRCIVSIKALEKLHKASGEIYPVTAISSFLTRLIILGFVCTQPSDLLIKY